MTVTRDTALFLLTLVDGLTLSVGASDFEQVVSQVIKARGELLDLVSEPTR
jgi:hypothetical protein